VPGGGRVAGQEDGWRATMTATAAAVATAAATALPARVDACSASGDEEDGMAGETPLWKAALVNAAAAGLIVRERERGGEGRAATGGKENGLTWPILVDFPCCCLFLAAPPPPSHAPALVP
jgi:hypothetical protein